MEAISGPSYFAIVAGTTVVKSAQRRAVAAPLSSRVVVEGDLDPYRQELGEWLEILRLVPGQPQAQEESTDGLKE